MYFLQALFLFLVYEKKTLKGLSLIRVMLKFAFRPQSVIYVGNNTLFYFYKNWLGCLKKVETFFSESILILELKDECKNDGRKVNKSINPYVTFIDL